MYLDSSFFKTNMFTVSHYSNLVTRLKLINLTSDKCKFKYRVGMKIYWQLFDLTGLIFPEFCHQRHICLVCCVPRAFG